VTTPLEDRIRSAFETHAGGPADDALDTVLTTAVRGGTRLRHRRTATAAVAGLAVLAVAAAGVLAVAGRPALLGPAAPGAPATTPAWAAVPATSSTTMPSPPEAPQGTVTAATDPTVVGTDVGLLHFRLGTLPVPSTQVSWVSEPHLEYAKLAVAAPSGPQEWPTEVMVTQDEVVLEVMAPEAGKADIISTPTTVGDRPATLLTQPHAGDLPGTSTVPRDAHGIRWQPVPGVWAEVESRSLAVGDLVRLAAGLRLDATYQCKVPVRTAAPPAGSRVTTCTMTYTATRPLETDLTYGGGYDSQLDVALVGPLGRGCGAAGKPRRGRDDVPQLCHLGTHVVRGWSVYIGHRGGYTGADEARAAAALRLAADPNDVGTWFRASAG
jgi:hypothetical protein